MFLSVFEIFQGWFMVVSGYFKVFKDRFEGVLDIFQVSLGCFKCVPWLIQWCFKFVCRVSLESYEDALLNSGGIFRSESSSITRAANLLSNQKVSEQYNLD